MFEQAQGVTKSKNESNNNSFMKVLDDYRITNKSNGQSPFIIKTGFEADDSRKGFSKSHFDNSAAFIASISVTYGDSTFGVMMLPDESGRVKFEKTPQYVPDLQTQTSVTQSGAEGALEAMAKYIDKNKGKKYGSFFGLMRNSNSFVKYVLKHTQDPNAQKLGKLHSPFTAERAADKVWTNANSNPKISVKDLRNPAEGENLIKWMSTNKKFAYLNVKLPEFFDKLIAVCEFGQESHIGFDKNIFELKKQLSSASTSTCNDALSVIKYIYDHKWISLWNASVILGRNGLTEDLVFKPFN